jgi:hypothetical protein
MALEDGTSFPTATPSVIFHTCSKTGREGYLTLFKVVALEEGTVLFDRIVFRTRDCFSFLLDVSMPVLGGVSRDVTLERFKWKPGFQTRCIIILKQTSMFGGCKAMQNSFDKQQIHCCFEDIEYRPAKLPDLGDV